MNWRRRTAFVLLTLSLLLPLFSLPAGASLPAAEETSRVLRVPAAATGQLSTLNLQPLLDLDYGAFRWLQLSEAEYARLQAATIPHELYDEPYTLRLGEQAFDPLHGVPSLPAGWERASTSGADLRLVQLVGPTRAEWLDTLRADGLEIVQYIHPYTYIVWGETDTLARAQANSFVRWTGDFAPAYRVLPQWRNLPDAPQQVSILLYRGADLAATVAQLGALGGSVDGPHALNNIFAVAGMSLSGPNFRAAAQVPGVYSIQPEPTAPNNGQRTEMSNQVNVNNVDGDNRAFPGYLGYLADVGVNGSGVIIANVDGGVQNSHPDLVNRLVACTGQTCGGSATDSHGTHTAGIMAADGSSGVTDSFGFLRGLGMAPGANLVEQVYFPWYNQANGMLLLMTESYRNGASVSGNSWGPSGSPRGYDDDTLQVDIGVRDADPTASGNQPLNWVLSFMNGNGGTSTQGTPDEAKNIFTIGSTKMQNGNGSQILAINDLSSNSAHGPALDGRKIPHMVAPGCDVDSTVPGGYDLLCGTSMASPHVSGAVALFIEYYRNLFGRDPSPALVKAAFLPVSHDLAGNDDADGNPLGHPFDSKQGWGRMDTDAVINPQLSVQYFDNPTLLNNTGQEWSQTLTPANPSQPMKLMLVWTDAPGHGLGGSLPAWNNNLDLVVEANSQSYKGNVFGSNGWSQTGGSADTKNNTEGVFLGPTAPGSTTVRVVASDINSDGVPNQGDTTDQDFALVCYNCAAEPTLVKTVNYQYSLNNGQSGSGSFRLLSDGSFTDAADNTGVWADQPSQGRLLLQYGPGQFCTALFVGGYTTPTTVQGPVFCRDGSGTRGGWTGTIIEPVETGPTSLGQSGLDVPADITGAVNQ